jgi:hypothetical protein
MQTTKYEEVHWTSLSLYRAMVNFQFACSFDCQHLLADIRTSICGPETMSKVITLIGDAESNVREGALRAIIGLARHGEHSGPSELFIRRLQIR